MPVLFLGQQKVCHRRLQQYLSVLVKNITICGLCWTTMYSLSTSSASTSAAVEIQKVCMLITDETSVVLFSHSLSYCLCLRYLEEQILTIAEDLLKYWVARKSLYPRLWKLARGYLCIPFNLGKLVSQTS